MALYSLSMLGILKPVYIENGWEFDFGPGDVPYMKSCASQEGEIKGVIVFNRNKRAIFKIINVETFSNLESI